MIVLLACALLVMAGISELSAENNLALNPGFEEGSDGWSGLWLREEGAGSAAVLREGAHSGEACLRLEHRGTQDWSWDQASAVPVAPGDILRLGGWVRVEKMDGHMQISVAVRSANGAVLAWTLGGAASAQTHAWRRLERRVVIGEGAATATLRVTGSGPSVVRLDDLFLVREGNLGEKRRASDFSGLVLENKRLRVRVAADLGMEVLDKRIRHTWTQRPAALPWVVAGAAGNKSDATILAHDALSGADLVIRLGLNGPELDVSLEAPSGAPLPYELRFPFAFHSRPTDFAVVPYAQGILFPVTELEHRRDFRYSGYKSTMAWCGITDLRSGYMILPTTPADSGVDIRPAGADEAPLLALHMVWDSEKGKWGYVRRATYAFFADGGYVAMAQRYRKWAEESGYVKTLRQKQAERPHIDRLVGAVNLWGRFDVAFYRDLRNLGIDRAVCSLGSGWRAPTGVADLIRELNSIGYLTSRYDIYTDVWPGAEDDEPRWARKHGYPEEVYVNADGSLRKGWVLRQGNAIYQGYYICATQHLREAGPRIASDLRGNAYTCRFIDVVTATGPTECYSDAHPVTRSGDIAARRQMLALASGRFGLVTGSEETRDWAVGVTDYGEGTMTIRAAAGAGYDWSGSVPAEKEYLRFNADGRYRVPLHALAFHDSHVATWYTGDGVLKAPEAWPQKDLLDMLYGGMPLWSLNPGLWEKHRKELVCSYYRVASITRAAGYERMLSHEFLTPDRRAQRSRFANGVQVTVNFGPEPYALAGTASPTRSPLRLPALGYTAVGPSLISYRAERHGQTVEYVETPERAMLIAPDRPHDGGALAAQGAVLVGHGLEGLFLLALKSEGPITLRACGPLSGRDLAQARVAGRDAQGQEMAVRHEFGKGLLVVHPIPGVERYDIIWK